MDRVYIRLTRCEIETCQYFFYIKCLNNLHRFKEYEVNNLFGNQ